MGLAINRPQHAINRARFTVVHRSIIHLGQTSTLSQKQCFGEIVPTFYRHDCEGLLKRRYMVNGLTEFGPESQCR
jgi:hypothetical protein